MEEVQLKPNRSRLYWLIFVFVTTASAVIILYCYGGRQMNEQNFTAEKKELSQTEKDRIQFSLAMESGELINCEPIKKDDLRRVCQVNLEDADIFENAITNMDAASCDKLNSEIRKKECIQAVESGSSEKRIMDIEVPADSLGTSLPPVVADSTKIEDIYLLVSDDKNIERYENALKTKVADEDLSYLLALSYGTKGLNEREFSKDQRNRTFFNKAFALVNSFEDTSGKIGQFYRVRAHLFALSLDYVSAVNDFERAIKELPDKSYLYLGLARAQYQTDDSKAALASIEKGLALLGKEKLNKPDSDVAKVEFYSVAVGVYHRLGDGKNEEKYKDLISSLMVAIKN